MNLLLQVHRPEISLHHWCLGDAAKTCVFMQATGTTTYMGI